MNNIQRTIVFLVISAVAWMLVDPWYSVGPHSYLKTGEALLWLAITGVAGFFLFKTKK